MNLTLILAISFWVYLLLPFSSVPCAARTPITLLLVFYYTRIFFHSLLLLRPECANTVTIQIKFQKSVECACARPCHPARPSGERIFSTTSTKINRPLNSTSNTILLHWNPFEMVFGNTMSSLVRICWWWLHFQVSSVRPIRSRRRRFYTRRMPMPTTRTR